MKNLLVIFLLLLPCIVFSQTKEKAEKAFVKELNSILKNSEQQHWSYEGKMSIDSAFAINKKGILSVSVRYATDSSQVNIRMEAPIFKAKSVAYDHYLILEYDQKDVSIQETVRGKEALSEAYTNNLFHIGVPIKGYKKQKKLEQLLQRVLQFY